MIEGKRIVAVGGGKGGVGKSVVACNLAVAFAQAGHSTVLVDADLGTPNLHTLLGIERPAKSLGDLLTKGKVRLSEVLTDTSVKDMKIVCGAAPILGVANPKFQQKQRIIREIGKLDAQVLVVDLGAGISYNVLDFFIDADVQIVLVSPQITSMHNAYGFIKSSLHRRLQRSIAGLPGYNDLFNRPGWSEEKMGETLSRANEVNPAYVGIFEAHMAAFKPMLLGNMVENKQELNVLWAMHRMVRDFLHVESEVLGGIATDVVVRRSINQRKPFLLSAPRHPNSRLIRNVAQTLAAIDPTRNKELRQSAAHQAKAVVEQREAGPEQARAGSGRPTQDQPEDDSGPAPIPFEAHLQVRARKESRHPLAIGAILRIGLEEHPVTLEDISRSGARLSGAPAVAVGDVIEVRLPATGDGQVWVFATVRHFDAARATVGCELVEVDETAREAIEWLIDGDTKGSGSDSRRQPHEAQRPKRYSTPTETENRAVPGE